MNIIDYIEKYKDLTLEEKELTEVDKLIFSLLSYVNYNGIVSNNEKHKKTIEIVGKEYFLKNTKKEIKRNLFPIRNAIKVLDSIRNTNRYKDLLLYNYIYKANDNQQFSALTIEINKNLVYISFEGTDHLISGWKEDFKMSYKFPIPAQKAAIRYLNKKFTHKNCEIIVGGHSKGGNLALVGAMYSNSIVRKKIIDINSYDSPGLRKKQFESTKFKNIKDKYNLVLNDNSIVGVLLLNNDNYKVIKANKLGVLAHDALNWEIEDDHFALAELSNSSIMIQKSLSLWLDKYTDKDRKKFVKYLFEIFKENEIVSLTQLLEDYKLLLKVFKSIKEVETLVIDMTKEFIKIVLDCNKQYIKDIIIDLTNEN